MVQRAPAQVVESEWVEFPGGELEGTRPRALCRDCREKLNVAAKRGNAAPSSSGKRTPLCFQCYRAELDRERTLAAAGQLDTASEARFQSALPFEPVDRHRLGRLRADRAAARAEQQSGIGRFVDKRRRAQIEARHALQRLAEGLRTRGMVSPSETRQALADGVHAAELQLPEAWLPFVLSR